MYFIVEKLGDFKSIVTDLNNKIIKFESEEQAIEHIKKANEILTARHQSPMKIVKIVNEDHFINGDLMWGECVECRDYFETEARDIYCLCDDCLDHFDLDKLWQLHDNDDLDALDFNEDPVLREQFRIKGGL